MKQIICDSHIEALNKQTYRNFKVYVTDNNSTDDSVLIIQELYSEAVIISLKENAGFARGNNIAAKKAIEDGADYLFILNPDIELAPDCIEELLTLAERDPNTGVVGPIMFFGLEEKENNKIQSYADTVNFRTANTSSMHANEHFLNNTIPEVIKVNMISGGIIFLKKELYIKTGLFEEKYYIYNEEVDFAWRVSKTSYLMYVTSRAKVWHHHNWSKKNRAQNHLMYYYINRNRFLFFRKHGLYLYLLMNLFKEFFFIPLKVRWALKYSDIHLIKYYYLGLIRGIAGETGKTRLNIN